MQKGTDIVPAGPDKRWITATSVKGCMTTYKANSSLSRRLYCFLGFMVLKRGSFMTSGQAAGQGLPHKRLKERTGLSTWDHQGNEG